MTKPPVCGLLEGMWRGIIGAVLAGLLLAAPASAARLAKLVPLSGQSTFTDCALEVPPPFSPDGFAPEDTAVEPDVAVDPRRPKRMAAAWMQDFTEGVVVASTVDGGRTWRRSAPQNLGDCTGSEGSTFDPRMVYGRDGTLFLSTMRNVVVPAGHTTPENEVAVSRSRDGGLTWSEPVTVEPRNGYNDFPTIATDPQDAKRVYVAWSELSEPMGGNSFGGFVATSVDGGRSFSAGRKVFDAGRPFFSHNVYLAAGSGGHLALLVELWDAQNFLPALPRVPNRILALHSADAGRTWSAPVEVARLGEAVAVSDPDSGEPVTPGLMTAAGAGDAFYATWVDGTGTQQSVWLARGHLDGTWDAPRKVAAAPAALLPAVAAGPGGSVAVTWFDTRNDRRGEDDQYTADAFTAVSADHGRTFEEVHVAGPVDLRSAYDDARAWQPGTTQRFLGDYVGVAHHRNGFRAALPLPAPIAEVGQSQIFLADVRSK